jgi:hypothetical protein
MGRTYRSNSDDKFTDQRRSEKKPNRAKRGGKLRALNSTVDYDTEMYDDYFDDEVELYDEIDIRHTKHTP